MRDAYPGATAVYEATLPIPPGINRTYRAGHGRLYMAPRAKAWKRTAAALLMHWQRPKPGRYRLSVTYRLYCSYARDIDGVAKAILDAVAERLGVNDRDVMAMTASKRVVPRSQYCVKVTVALWPVLGDA